MKIYIGFITNGQMVALILNRVICAQCFSIQQVCFILGRVLLKVNIKMIYVERERTTVVRVDASFDLETGKSLPLTKGWSNSALY